MANILGVGTTALDRLQIAQQQAFENKVQQMIKNDSAKVNENNNIDSNTNSNATLGIEEDSTVVNNTITAQDSLVRRYGIRQEIVIKNDNEDPNIKARRILADNCKPKEEIEVECIGDLDYRVGFGVHLYVPFLPQYSDCLMYVKSVEHEWKPNGIFISKLTLTPSRVMDEKEWSDTTENDEDSSSSSGSDLWTKIYLLLKQQIGKPYVYGATGPDSFDCSGLVQYCYNQFENEIGFHINRTTYEQIKQGKQIDNTNMDEWEPGDLVFPHEGHVVVYTGGGKCIEAMKTGTNVMEHEYSRNSTYAVRRVLPEATQIYDNVSVDLPTSAISAIQALCEDAVNTVISNMNKYDFKDKLIKISKEKNVTPYMCLAIIAIESNGNPNCSSSAGANGLMQVLNGSFDIETNIRQGCDVYNEKCNYYNNASTFIALEAYNYGQGNVDKILSKIGKKAGEVSIKEWIDNCSNSEAKYYACKVLYANSLLRSKKALN